MASDPAAPMKKTKIVRGLSAGDNGNHRYYHLTP